MADAPHHGNPKGRAPARVLRSRLRDAHASEQAKSLGTRLAEFGFLASFFAERQRMNITLHSERAKLCEPRGVVVESTASFSPVQSKFIFQVKILSPLNFSNFFHFLVDKRKLL
ncbi:MAG: hypothetical protein J6R04_06625 [Clostridia bacterium]|nr:hypothetical protein [Clostridia bacterium]